VIHTPGHTKDSICIYVGDAVFTGDTLFTGKVGGTYTEEQALDEYESLHQKLMQLPGETEYVNKDVAFFLKNYSFSSGFKITSLTTSQCLTGREPHRSGCVA